jgi:hypothetical protein
MACSRVNFTILLIEKAMEERHHVQR